VNFELHRRCRSCRKSVRSFMDAHVYPNEHKCHEHARSERRWVPVPVIEGLSRGQGGGALEPVAPQDPRRRA